jgi:hypothetical protein
LSAVLQTRRRSTMPMKLEEPVKETETGLSGYSPEPQRLGSRPEAPEDAFRKAEPPESWVEWQAEAPDAGRGDSLSVEHDFTHGRSRS